MCQLGSDFDHLGLNSPLESERGLNDPFLSLETLRCHQALLCEPVFDNGNIESGDGTVTVPLTILAGLCTTKAQPKCIERVKLGFERPISSTW
jgi:hypothetical protein